MVSNKTGLSYFGIDTDIFQDRKIKRLKKTFGCAGIAIYIYLLCDVYRDKGCVLAWDEDCAFDVAEYLGVKESLVNEVVKYCGAVGLFNEELLSRGIITSESIQRRYIEMCKRARRSSTNIPEEWRLITEESGKITEECGETTEDCEVTPTFSDKEKKRKEKESKEKESSVCEEAPTPTPTHVDEKILISFKNYGEWAEQCAPTLLLFKEPLSIGQYAWLRQRYTIAKIQKTGEEMHNKEMYTKARSAFLTFKSWIQRC